MKKVTTTMVAASVLPQTSATTAAMTNVNGESQRMLALPPSDYRALRSNDAPFLLDPANPNENLSWEKGILPNEYFPTDLDASKCDYFKNPRGDYVLLGYGRISSDSQIKDALLREKSTF